MHLPIDDLVIVSEEPGFICFYDADGNETRIDVRSGSLAQRLVRAIYVNLRTYENVEKWVD